MKNFKNVKAGDRMYTVTIKDSVIQKDCVGNIIVDYHVSRTCYELSSPKIEITLQKMYYKYQEGYVKEDREGHELVEETIGFNKTDESCVLNTKENTNDFGININCSIIAPTKKALLEKLISIVDSTNVKINKMREILKLEENKKINMELTLNLAIPYIKLEEEEKNEYSLEEAASMAL